MGAAAAQDKKDGRPLAPGDRSLAGRVLAIKCASGAQRNKLSKRVCRHWHDCGHQTPLR